VSTPKGGARVRAHRVVYEGKVLSLHVDEVEEPEGARATREVVRHRGSVAALAITDDGRIVLVRQYRYPVDESVWELPAGRLDAGEDPETAVQRELQEEIGQKAGRLEKIAFFYTTPGFCDEAMHVFRASGLTASKLRGDDDERIEVRTFALEELRRMIASGEIREGKTLVALLMELARAPGSAARPVTDP